MRSLLIFLFLLSAASMMPGQPSPTVAGLDLGAIDKNVDPCVDFYQHACGTWMATHPIPPDESRWGRSSELLERNREVLHKILEHAAQPDPKRNTIEREIGDYYAACMDEKGIEQKGIKPLQPYLDQVRAISSKKDLVDEVARLHHEGTPVFFRFGPRQDAKDSTQTVASADQGGLGLPDRDYYLKDDPHSVDLRKRYLEHLQKTFRLLGDSPEQSEREANAVMAIETALASRSLTRVELRDPNKTYHKMTVAELSALSPSFAWPRYLEEVGAPKIQSLNVAVPDFFKEIETVLDTIPLDDLKTYLTWHIVHNAAPLLPSAFVAANFEFFGKTLTGAKELRPRWKRCVEQTDLALGEALGQKFVELTFGERGKQRTLQMVHEIENEMAKDIRSLDWMSPATKDQALTKLQAVANKIGYPEKWRDYSSIQISRDDALGNDQRASVFETRRRLAKIGKPLDKKDWAMTPPTVNAYYNPPMNDINFPAGILQAPFYDNKADDAVNYGGIGAVIGHELTHGFDDQGRQFDASGNLRDWWTASDGAEFKSRADCIADEYSGFTSTGDVKLNGRLTLGENAADNGGLRLAYMALMDSLANHTQEKIAGYTPAQRFFLGYGQIWCQNQTEESLRMRAQTDPHSPGRYRVNGVLQNMPEFRQAFGCKVGQPMASERSCRVW